MDGYTLWKLHRAVHLHLTTLKYDLFEHNGRVRNTGQDVYIQSNYRKMYETIARHLSTPKDGVDFCIANIIYTPKDCFLDSSVSWDLRLKYLRHKESLTKFVMDDIDVLDLPAATIATPGGLPKLLHGVIAGIVLPQTAVVLNRRYGFVDKWIEDDYFGFKQYSVRIKKMERFVKCNMEKIDQLIDEKLEYATI